MFDYPVLSEQEAMNQRYHLLENGNYEAVIKKVTHKKSNSGNDMYVLDLNVYDKEGKIHFLKDYLVFSNKMIWKVRHCADSCSLIDKYESKSLTEDLLIDKNIIVKISTQEGSEIPEDKLNGKPVGSRYPTKNVIEDYIKQDLSSVKNKDKFINDDVPF